MRTAWHLASQSLPDHTSKFSRKDFTPPQLFACLVVKEQMRRSYRGAEALLRDCDNWLRDIGLRRASDHNTLCRAAAFLLTKCRVNRLLDKLVQWAALAGILGLSTDPLAIDSTTYESRHVSRHYERRCRQTHKRLRAKDAENGRKRTRSDTVKGLPKLGIAVATASHFILSVWTGTGAGADHPHFERVLLDAWRRVPHKSFTVVADAGYDGEEYHQFARRDMGIRSIIPPQIGRPRKDGGPPGGRWRRLMKRLLKTKRSRRRCKYNRRYQIEVCHPYCLHCHTFDESLGQGLGRVRSAA
jgi:hypothetical protein